MKGRRYSHDPKAVTQLQRQCDCVFMTIHFVNVGPSAAIACKTVDLVSIPRGPVYALHLKSVFGSGCSAVCVSVEQGALANRM